VKQLQQIYPGRIVSFMLEVAAEAREVRPGVCLH
jgi:hypothetical protein